MSRPSLPVCAAAELADGDRRVITAPGLEVLVLNCFPVKVVGDVVTVEID